MQILGQLTGQSTEQTAPPSAQTREAPVFAQSGREYKDPTLVLFSGQVNSTCWSCHLGNRSVLLPG